MGRGRTRKQDLRVVNAQVRISAGTIDKITQNRHK